MRGRPCRRPWAAPVPATVLLAAAMLAGCGTPAGGSGTDSGSRVDEVAAHRGQVCPHQLPQASARSHGFGTSEPADSAPSLPVPESAWVCQYVPDDAASGPDGDGTTFRWVRNGQARRVAKSQLPVLGDYLRALAPPEGDRVCTASLGPRWMLVYATGTDLTGVVVDGFGCQDVRLTDEPFRTVPGEATQSGTVPGVLTGPTELLAQLVADRRF